MALDAFVNYVRLNSGSNQTVCTYISSNFDVLLSNVNNLDSAYGNLSPDVHTLGAQAILLAKYMLLKSATLDFETLFLQTQEFVNSCQKDQICYASERFAEIFHRLTAQLVERKIASRGISLLSVALEKLRAEPGQLTSLHSDLCQLCLLARNLKPALPYIDVNFTDICREGKSIMDGKHLLTFYYYGAMIFIGLKRFEKAAYFLDTAVSVPAVVVSHVMIEAYKKYQLVSLIHKGAGPTLRKCASPVVTRYIKPLATEYHDLVTAFVSHSVEKLSAVVDNHRSVFESDSNMGLVMQCVKCQYKKKIQMLTKTFLTLSLTDVANRVQLPGPDEAEKYLCEMIEDGEIFATINQQDGMVNFLDNPEQYNNPQMMAKLEEEISLCIAVNEKMSSMDREISLDPEFIRKSHELHGSV